MMKAQKGWTIVRYEKEMDYQQSTSGIHVPSQRNQRFMMKGKSHVISADPDHNLPDLMRVGEVVTSAKYEDGASLLFNKNNGDGFELDGAYYFAIRDEHVVAVMATAKERASG